MLVLSWRRPDVPALFLAGAPRTDPRRRRGTKAEEEMKTGPGAWFVQTGCFVCHSISALGVKSPAQIGPDLSTAVEDVQSRFGMTHRRLPREPDRHDVGRALAPDHPDPEQKEVAIQKLREAFAEHQRAARRRPLAAISTSQ